MGLAFAQQLAGDAPQGYTPKTTTTMVTNAAGTTATAGKTTTTTTVTTSSKGKGKAKAAAPKEDVPNAQEDAHIAQAIANSFQESYVPVTTTTITMHHDGPIPLSSTGPIPSSSSAATLSVPTDTTSSSLAGMSSAAFVAPQPVAMEAAQIAQGTQENPITLWNQENSPLLALPKELQVKIAQSLASSGINGAMTKEHLVEGRRDLAHFAAVCTDTHAIAHDTVFLEAICNDFMEQYNEKLVTYFLAMVDPQVLQLPVISRDNMIKGYLKDMQNNEVSAQQKMMARVSGFKMDVPGFAELIEQYKLKSYEDLLRVVASGGHDMMTQFVQDRVMWENRKNSLLCSLSPELINHCLVQMLLASDGTISLGESLKKIVNLNGTSKIIHSAIDPSFIVMKLVESKKFYLHQLMDVFLLQRCNFASSFALALLPFVEDVNQTDMFGSSFLALSVAHGNVRVVKALCENPATNVNGQNSMFFLNPLLEEPVFWSAIRRGYLNTLRELLKRDDLDINATVNDVSALILAAALENDVILELLLTRKDIEINHRNVDRETALHVAAQNRFGVFKCMQLLLDAGADPEIRNNSGQTAFDLLLGNRHVSQDAAREFIDSYRARQQ